MDLSEIAVEIYRNGLIKFGDFILTSGRRSPYYIDLRLLPSYPRLYRNVMNHIINMVKDLDFDVVAGIETAGIVHAAYLGCLLEKPIAYVRKKTKAHGTRKLVEGAVENKNVLLIDDVSTTGGSLEYGVKTLREYGAIVKDVVVIIDRLEGAIERLSKLGVRFHRLMDIAFILNILKKKKLITESEYNSVIRHLEGIYLGH